MRKLRIGFIGAGSPNVATSAHLPALKQSDVFEIVMLADINPQVEKYAAEYACEWTNNAEDLISREDIDIIAVCTPDQFHYDLVKKGLLNNKHIVCEKPLALESAQVEELFDYAEKQNLVLSIVSNARYLPIWKRFKEKLHDVKSLKYSVTGSIFSYPDGSFYRKAESGGQFVHNGYHLCDLMCFLSSSQPEEVIGGSAYGGTTAKNYDFNTYTLSCIRMENGVIATIEQDLTRPREFKREERLVGWCYDSHVIYDNTKDIPAPDDFDAAVAFSSYYHEVYQQICGEYCDALKIMNRQKKVMKTVLKTAGRQFEIKNKNTSVSIP